MTSCASTARNQPTSTERTQRALDVLEQLEEVVPLADVIAADFIDRLDHTRFSTLKNALENRFIVYPVTLQAAYRLAAGWKIEPRNGGGPPVLAGNMFVVRGGHSGRGRGREGRGGGRGGRDGGRGGRGGGSPAPSKKEDRRIRKKKILSFRFAGPQALTLHRC